MCVILAEMYFVRVKHMMIYLKIDILMLCRPIIMCFFYDYLVEDIVNIVYEIA